MCRKGVPQGMRRVGVGQPYRTAEPFHRQLHDTRGQWLAARPDKKWPVRRIPVWAQRDVVGDYLRDLRKHRHHPRFVTLAGDNETVGLAREVLVLQPERFGNPETASI